MEKLAKEMLQQERELLKQEQEQLLGEISRIRDEVSRIQEQIEAITLLVGDKPPHRTFKLTSQKSLKNLPIISIVRTVLRDAGEAMDLPAVMDVLRECGLHNIKESSVRTSLVRLVDQPEVERVERGVYRFVFRSESDE